VGAFIGRMCSDFLGKVNLDLNKLLPNGKPPQFNPDEIHKIQEELIVFKLVLLTFFVGDTASSGKINKTPAEIGQITSTAIKQSLKELGYAEEGIEYIFKRMDKYSNLDEGNVFWELRRRFGSIVVGGAQESEIRLAKIKAVSDVGFKAYEALYPVYINNLNNVAFIDA
jgi:hypothetical protein